MSVVTDLDAETPGRTGRESAFAHVTPNWFASVMGTGIIATSAAALPMGASDFHLFAVGVWLIATVLLIGLLVSFAVHWIRYTANARWHATHPVMSHFYGAPAMAFVTVGSGTVTLGEPLIGVGAVWISGALWLIGTILGVFTSIWVPYLMITRHIHQPDGALPLPAWLMPVVPPMVSATGGALLVPHMADGQWRLALLCSSYALFGLSFFLGMITMTLIYGRIVTHGAPSGAATPTIWITLGMIGQSITAANLLGGVPAHTVFGGDRRFIAEGLEVFGIGYGLLMGGFGVMMMALAVALTAREVRRGMPFAMTWWSFTFPVGTCVTGLAALGKVLGAEPIEIMSVVLFGVLLTAWAIVAIRTVATGVRELATP